MRGLSLGFNPILSLELNPTDGKMRDATKKTKIKWGEGHDTDEIGPVLTLQGQKHTGRTLLAAR